MTITDYMTIEEIFSRLYEEYGESKFNWQFISFSNKSFVNELKKELGDNDAFIMDDVWAVAKCTANDDVLFVNINGPWRIYHLTYSSNNAEGFPRYIEFADRKEVGEYWQNQIINSFGSLSTGVVDN